MTLEAVEFLIVKPFFKDHDLSQRRLPYKTVVICHMMIYERAAFLLWCLVYPFTALRFIPTYVLHVSYYAVSVVVALFTVA